MDQVPSLQGGEELGSLIDNQITELLQADDVDNFVSIIKGQLGRENKDDDNSKLCPSKLLVSIFHHGALQCAAALVSGETGMHVKLNVALQSGMFPLHHAAQALSPFLTDLFLKKGAKADLGCNVAGLKFNGLLPLNVAVETLGRHIEWTPKQSVFDLVLTLGKFDWKDSLDTIRLLTERTAAVREVIFQYASEGKLIEFAALLMVAWDRVLLHLDGGIDDGLFKGSMTLRRFIAIEIAALVDEEYRVMGSGSRELALTKEKKSFMMDMMMLLEIFQRKGERIASAMRLFGYDEFGGGTAVRAIASRLKSADLPFKKDSDLASVDDTALETWRGGKLPNDIYLPCFPQSYSLLNGNPRTRMSNEGQGLPMKRGLSSAALSFNMLRSSEASSDCALYTILDTQVKKPTKAMEQRVRNFLAGEKLPSFALALKRHIARV